MKRISPFPLHPGFFDLMFCVLFAKLRDARPEEKKTEEAAPVRWVGAEFTTAPVVLPMSHESR